MVSIKYCKHLLTSACINHDIELFKEFYHSHAMNNKDLTLLCSSNGFLDGLKYLVEEHNSKMHEDVMKVAAKNGHIKCLEYLHSVGVKLDRRVTRVACDKGYLDILEFAHKNGCNLHSHSALIAIKKSYYDCLLYLFNNGFNSYISQLMNYIEVKLNEDLNTDFENVPPELKEVVKKIFIIDGVIVMKKYYRNIYALLKNIQLNEVKSCNFQGESNQKILIFA
jgi:hypothetical protein